MWCCHALNNKNTPLQCHYQGWSYLSLSFSLCWRERVFLRSDRPASERLLVGNVPTWAQAARRQRHKRPGESSKCQPRAFFERIIRRQVGSSRPVRFFIITVTFPPPPGRGSSAFNHSAHLWIKIVCVFLTAAICREFEWKWCWDELTDY